MSETFNPFAAAVEATKTLTSNVRQGGLPDSKLYRTTIKAAYFIANAWNANKTDLVFHLELPSGFQHKQAFTVLQDGKPSFMKDGKDTMLRGYIEASHLVGAATDGKTINDVYGSIEDKMVKVYDFDKKAEVDTSVKALVDLVGLEVNVGLVKQVKNKVVNEGTQVSPNWVDQPERKETILFQTASSVNTNLTYAEMNGGVAEADAKEADAWAKLNNGKTWDTYREIKTTSGVPAGVGIPTSGAAEVQHFG